jgi:hypothetical protein
MPMLDGVRTPAGAMQSFTAHSTPEITREIDLQAISEEQRRAVEDVQRLAFRLKWTHVQPSTQPTSS